MALVLPSANSCCKVQAPSILVTIASNKYKKCVESVFDRHFRILFASSAELRTLLEDLRLFPTAMPGQVVTPRDGLFGV